MWREVLITFRLDHSYPWCYLLTVKLLGPRVLHPRPIDPKRGHNLQLTCTRPWEQSSNPGWKISMNNDHSSGQASAYFHTKGPPPQHRTRCAAERRPKPFMATSGWPLPSWMGLFEPCPINLVVKEKCYGTYVKIIQIYRIYKHIDSSS